MVDSSHSVKSPEQAGDPYRKAQIRREISGASPPKGNGAPTRLADRVAAFDLVGRNASWMQADMYACITQKPRRGSRRGESANDDGQ
jgi:hypothetical protein